MCKIVYEVTLKLLEYYERYFLNEFNEAIMLILNAIPHYILYVMYKYVPNAFCHTWAFVSIDLCSHLRVNDPMGNRVILYYQDTLRIVDTGRNSVTKPSTCHLRFYTFDYVVLGKGGSIGIFKFYWPIISIARGL